MEQEYWPRFIVAPGQSMYWRGGTAVFLSYDSWESLLVDYASGVLFLAPILENDPFPHSFLSSNDPEWPALEQIILGTLP